MLTTTLTDRTAVREVPHGRAQSAVGHITRAASKPVIHFTSAMHKHFELLAGFSDVHTDTQAVPAGCLRAQAQQFRHGGVRCVRRKASDALFPSEQVNAIEGFLERRPNDDGFQLGVALIEVGARALFSHDPVQVLGGEELLDRHRAGDHAEEPVDLGLVGPQGLEELLHVRRRGLQRGQVARELVHRA